MMNINDLLIGIKKSEQNALELIDDAELMFYNGRYPRAFALYQLANEEIGKCSLMQYYILQNNKDNLANFLKEFRSHKIKTSYSNGIEMIIYNYLNESNKKLLLETIIYNSKNIEKINNLKNYSLYTSFIESKFMIPSEILKKEDVEVHLNYVVLRFNIIKVINKLFIENYNVLINEFSKLNVEENVLEFLDKEKGIIDTLSYEEIFRKH